MCSNESAVKTRGRRWQQSRAHRTYSDNHSLFCASDSYLLIFNLR
jgi:hypothetical protein